jgi:hypothetical protein
LHEKKSLGQDPEMVATKVDGFPRRLQKRLNAIAQLC